MADAPERTGHAAEISGARREAGMGEWMDNGSVRGVRLNAPDNVRHRGNGMDGRGVGAPGEEGRPDLRRLGDGPRDAASRNGRRYCGYQPATHDHGADALDDASHLPQLVSELIADGDAGDEGGIVVLRTSMHSRALSCCTLEAGAYGGYAPVLSFRAKRPDTSTNWRVHKQGLPSLPPFLYLISSYGSMICLDFSSEEHHWTSGVLTAGTVGRSVVVIRPAYLVTTQEYCTYRHLFGQQIYCTYTTLLYLLLWLT